MADIISVAAKVVEANFFNKYPAQVVQSAQTYHRYTQRKFKIKLRQGFCVGKSGIFPNFFTGEMLFCFKRLRKNNFIVFRYGKLENDKLRERRPALEDSARPAPRYHLPCPDAGPRRQ